MSNYPDMSDSYQFEQEEWARIARTDPRAVIGDETIPYDGSAPTELMATEKQIKFMEDLRDGKDLSSLLPGQIAWLRDADFSKVPRRRASDVIGAMKDLPKAGKDAANLPDVPDGRYAIPKDDGTLMFYSVKKGRTITFVDVWASDTRYPVQNASERMRILTAIKDDPDAGPRFGREIGRCYVCGRTLTDETSRQLGIGPICRGA